MAVDLFYGETGAGKSLAMRDLVREHLVAHRVFAVDHDFQWGPEGYHWRGRPPPMRIYDAGAKLPAGPEDWPETGLFVFRKWWPEEVYRLAIRVGNVVLADDECDKTATKDGWRAKYPPMEPWKAENPLRPIVHEGRHLPNELGEICEVHFMGACRRPQNLHTDVSELAREIYVFRLKGENTIARLLGDGTITPDEVTRVRELPNLEFKHMPSGEWLRVKKLRDVSGNQDTRK